jgi:hypothetical protein
LNILTIFNLNPIIFLGRVNAPPGGKFHDVLQSGEKFGESLSGSQFQNIMDGRDAEGLNFLEKSLKRLELFKRRGVYANNCGDH